ncbi:MAG TPA: arylesterase [Nitrospirales bacterium]|nr:arylesterase [Nitrospirales bacterium]
MDYLLRAIALAAFLTVGVEACDQQIGKPAPKIQGTSVDARPGTKSPPPSNTAARPEERVLVAFGDSLTAGLGVSPEETYPARLQEKLLLSGYRYRIINAGVSGDTSAGGLRRVEWVLKSKPDIVILELGANDGLRGLNLAQTRTNLEEIIQRFLAGGAKVVLAGMKLPPNYGADYTKAFQSMYADLAKRYDVQFIPFFLDGVAAKADYNQADGIHPTGSGYAVIVENIWPVIEPLLKK